MRILVYSAATGRGTYTLEGSSGNISENIRLLPSGLAYLAVEEGEMSSLSAEDWKVENGSLVYSPPPTPRHHLDAEGNWVLPPPDIPTRVTMRQARLALHSSGVLQIVNEIVASIPGSAGEAARIEWEYALTVDRDSALVANLATQIPLSEAELDALFLLASTL